MNGSPANGSTTTKDAEWLRRAREVLVEAIVQTRQSLRSQGRPERWQVLWERILFPTLAGQPPMDYDRLVARFGYQSPEEATEALVLATRQFNESLQTGFIQQAQSRQERGQATPVPPSANADSGIGPSDALDGEVQLARVASSESIRALFARLEDTQCPWDPHDLAEIWKHQLRLPLSHLVEMSEELLTMTLSPMSASDLTDWTLGELLRHPAPPLTWLEGLKRASRHETRPTARMLPKETATVMYFSAIASALVRRGTRISRSGDEVLDLGFSECLGYPWLDEGTRGLLERARQHVGRDSSN